MENHTIVTLKKGEGRTIKAGLSLPKGLAEQTGCTENNADYHC